MKRLIILISLFTSFGVRAQVGVAPYAFWTNYIDSGWATNYTLGTAVIPLSSNGLAGVLWASKTWNAQQNMPSTNKYIWKDAVAYGAWIMAEQWGKMAADAKATQNNIAAIKAVLPNATEVQLSNACVALGIPFAPSPQ